MQSMPRSENLLSGIFSLDPRCPVQPDLLVAAMLSPLPRPKRFQSTEDLQGATLPSRSHRIRPLRLTRYASSPALNSRMMADQLSIPASPSPLRTPMIPPRSSSRVTSGPQPRSSSRPTSPTSTTAEQHIHTRADWNATFPGRNSPNHHVVQITSNTIVATMEEAEVERVDDSGELGSQVFLPHDGYSTGSPSLAGSGLESVASTHHTNATSMCPLQTREGMDWDDLYPLDGGEVEPGSFDLIAPNLHHPGTTRFSLEERSEQLFSREHLAVIFDDPILLVGFTSFVRTSRPSSVPLLAYYFDALKALKAINYSNALVESLGALEDHGFARHPASFAFNTGLEEKVHMAFGALVRDELPAYITHRYIQITSSSIRKRITGTLPSHLRQMSEGLAEVFCLSDPSREGNPIVFASEEFYRTTQYGLDHTIGRNCRFLQGPKTNPYSVERLRKQLAAGKEHYETILNYRRDGSPFMNLLMCAPLLDSRGNIRYMIGAQVDVSGLAKDCAGLESLRRLVNRGAPNGEQTGNGAFREMSDMFSGQEIETVRKHGGDMYRLHREGIKHEEGISNWPKPRVVIQDEIWTGLGETSIPDSAAGGRLAGIYEHYVLVRPYPNLRILFASPSFRMPGILQTPFLSRIGGSDRVREEIEQAFADGTVLTARIKWVSKNDTTGRSRWIHCTPLIGSNGAVGVWMVIFIDDEETSRSRKERLAPPVKPMTYLNGRKIRDSAFDDELILDVPPRLDELSTQEGLGVGVGVVGPSSPLMK